MAYGIGSILGDIDQKADAYRNNPDALAQSYQQNQQLIDLLVLQKLKTDKEAAQRDMQAKMQTPAATIKDQRAQEVMGMTRNEVAQQVTPGLQALGQQMQAAQAQPQAQGIASVPAPNMQQVGMADGGIIAFAGPKGSEVKGTRLRAQDLARVEKEKQRIKDQEDLVDLYMLNQEAKSRGETYTPPIGLSDIGAAIAAAQGASVPESPPYDQQPRGENTPLELGHMYGANGPIPPRREQDPTAKRENNARLRAQEAGGTYAERQAERQAEHLANNSEQFRHMYGANVATPARQQIGEETAVTTPVRQQIGEETVVTTPVRQQVEEETTTQRARNARASNPLDAITDMASRVGDMLSRAERVPGPEVASRPYGALPSLAEELAVARRNIGPSLEEYQQKINALSQPPPSSTGKSTVTPGAVTETASPVATNRGISTITNADNERNVASMLGEDLGARKVPETTSNGISTVAPNAISATRPAAPENEDAIYQASLAPNGISSITNAYKERNAANERNVASMLGEDLSVLNVPAEDVAKAPSAVRESYTQQLAALRGEEESRLEYLIAFLKGAGGHTSFAAGMMGGSDAMNAREAQVKGEIMDVLGKLETIDLKEREFGLKERELGQTDTQLKNQSTNIKAVNDAAIERNRIDAATQRATQALQEAQAANLGSPTLTDQEMQADAYVKNALEQGSTKSVVALKQEYYRQRVADEQKVALARLGITDETSKQELILKVVKAADEAFGNLPNSFSMTPEEQQTWKTAHMANTYAELKNASSLSTAAPPVKPVDPNDPAADFYN